MRTVTNEPYNDTGALPATRVPMATAMPAAGQAGGAAGVVHADAAPPAAVVASGTSWPTADAMVRAEAQLAVLRARGARVRPERSPSGTGCAWCGCSHSVSWTASPWSWAGNGHGNHQAYFCETCGRRWTSCRCTVDSWRGHMAAEALGLDRTPIELLSTTLPSFRESASADRRGSRERWAFLFGGGQ